MSPLAPPSHHPPEDEDDGIYLAAVEGGGTTFVVSVAKVIRRRDDGGDDYDDDDDDDKEEEENILRIGPTKLLILETRSFPPRDEITGIIPSWTPDMIVGETCAFLTKCRAEIVPGGGRYSAVGIATFAAAIAIIVAIIATVSTLTAQMPCRPPSLPLHSVHDAISCPRPP